MSDIELLLGQQAQVAWPTIAALILSASAFLMAVKNYRRSRLPLVRHKLEVGTYSDVLEDGTVELETFLKLDLLSIGADIYDLSARLVVFTVGGGGWGWSNFFFRPDEEEQVPQPLKSGQAIRLTLRWPDTDEITRRYSRDLQDRKLSDYSQLQVVIVIEGSGRTIKRIYGPRFIPDVRHHEERAIIYAGRDC